MRDQFLTSSVTALETDMDKTSYKILIKNL